LKGGVINPYPASDPGTEGDGGPPGGDGYNLIGKAEAAVGASKPAAGGGGILQTSKTELV
jgi:hypothetical protein